MKRCKSVLLRMYHTAAVCGLLVLFGSTSYAAWFQIMQEDFEQPATLWTDQTRGPWYQPARPQTWARQWIVRPGLPNSAERPWRSTTTAPNMPQHWGIQNKIYKVDPVYPERYVQATWCDASNDDQPINGAGRDPEFDTYRNIFQGQMLHTVMYWGPIDLSNYANMRCQFEWTNHTLPGDTLEWGATANTGGPLAADYRSRFFPAVFRSGDSARRGFSTGDWHQRWYSNVTKIDSLDSMGTIVSLAHRGGVYFYWRFKSTNTQVYTNHLDIKGAFIDNVKVALDDGFYNLNALYCSHLRARDSIPILYPQVLDTILFQLRYGIVGNGVMRDTAGLPARSHIACTINGAPYFDTTVVVNAGAESMTYTLYAPPYIPRIQGMYTVRWQINADRSIRESNYNDNNCVDSVFVIRPNSPPTVRFISLQNADTIVYRRTYGTNTYYPMIVNVYDEDDSASWYLYISQDSTVGIGTPLNMIPAFPWGTHSRPNVNDTVWVNVGELPDSVYWYFSVLAMDPWNTPVWGRPRGCLTLVEQPNAAPEHATYLPSKTALYNSYPNPFNSEVTFKIGLAENTQGELRIFDVMGRDVSHLKVPGTQPGWYNVQWRATGLPSGVYFAQFITRGRTISTTKLMYIK